jgi:hypothetical protein
MSNQDAEFQGKHDPTYRIRCLAYIFCFTMSGFLGFICTDSDFLHSIAFIWFIIMLCWCARILIYKIRWDKTSISQDGLFQLNATIQWNNVAHIKKFSWSNKLILYDELNQNSIKISAQLENYEDLLRMIKKKCPQQWEITSVKLKQINESPYFHFDAIKIIPPFLIQIAVIICSGIIADKYPIIPMWIIFFLSILIFIITFWFIQISFHITSNEIIVQKIFRKRIIHKDEIDHIETKIETLYRGTRTPFCHLILKNGKNYSFGYFNINPFDLETLLTEWLEEDNSS